MKKRVVELVNTELRGLKVLVLDPKKERAVKHEMLAEQDPLLQRIDIYFASSIEEGRDYVRKYAINLAIFPDFPPVYDFVDIHLEFRGESKNLETIPLVKAPTLTQYRECKVLGGIFDLQDPDSLERFDAIRSIILNYLRHLSRGVDSEKLLGTTNLISKALVIRTSTPHEFKVRSSLAFAQVITKFDLNSMEILLGTAVEQIFFPDITIGEYRNLLSDVPFDLLPIIESCSSWTSSKVPPRSVTGFSITFANYLSYVFELNPKFKAFEEVLKDRPVFLKHSAIRAIDVDTLRNIFNSFSNKIQKVG